MPGGEEKTRENIIKHFNDNTLEEQADKPLSQKGSRLVSNKDKGNKHNRETDRINYGFMKINHI